MGSALILVTVLLFLTVVAAFLSLAAGSPWRVVRDLLLVVAVIAGAYALGIAAMVAPEWRDAFIAAALSFVAGSVVMRLSAYRPSRHDPDRPRGVLWRRPALVALCAASGLWLVTASLIDWRLRAAIDAGIAEAESALEPMSARRTRDVAPIYDAVASRLRDDESAPEAASAVLASDWGISRWSLGGETLTLEPSLLADLESLELEEAQALLEEVRDFFRRHEKDLATLRRAARDPRGHLTNAEVEPCWERVGLETRLRAVWACGSALHHQAREAERAGDIEEALASARAIEGLTDQLLRTGPLGFEGFRMLNLEAARLDLEPLLASSSVSPRALEAWARVGASSYLKRLPRIVRLEERRLLRLLAEHRPQGGLRRFLRLVRFPALVDRWRSTLREVLESASFSYPKAVTRAVPGASETFRDRSELVTFGFDSEVELRLILAESGPRYAMWTPESLFSHLPTTVDLLIRVAARTDARRRLERAGIALYRHHLKEGRFPETLGALVPDYLQAIPRDPYDGRPLRYRPGEADCLVYSVGPDGRDDAGQDDAGEALMPESSQGLDLVFRCRGASTRQAGGDPSGQIVTAASIIDHDYRFRIDVPDESWDLLGETEIRKLAPDAVAGANSGRVYGAVVVEEAPLPELKACVKVVLDALRGEDGQVPILEDIRFQERPAVRVGVTRTIQGFPARCEIVVFLSGGYLYQIANWGPQGGTDEDGFDFRPFLNAFHLLEGEVRPRAPRIDTVDRIEVGREVRDGVLRSAAARLVVAPRAPWRLAAGDELAELNPSAEAALVSSEASFEILCERGLDLDREAYAAFLAEEFAAGLEAVPGELTMKIGGEPIALARYRDPESPEQIALHGVHWRGDLCYHFGVWYVSRDAGRVEEDLPRAFESIGFLKPEEAEAMAAELAARPDPETSVGPDFSLRRGVYRDFGHGVIWRKPEGFWRVSAGEAARRRLEDGLLYIKEPWLGIRAMFFIRPAEGLGTDDLHRAVASSWLGEDHPALSSSPTEARLDHLAARSTAAEVKGRGYAVEYRILTALRGEEAIELIVRGLAGNMRAHPGRIDEVVRGFVFPRDGLTSSEQVGERYADHRLGFSLASPGPDYTFADSTSDEFSALGAQVSWRKGAQFLMALAVWMANEQQDAISLAETFQRGMGRAYGLSLRAPVTGQTTLAGLPSKHVQWKTDGVRIEAFFLVRERIFFSLWVVDEDGTLTTESARRCFSFLE